MNLAGRFTSSSRAQKAEPLNAPLFASLIERLQTAEERSRLVYRIKVSVDNSAGVLKQGMPVDAELALQ